MSQYTVTDCLVNKLNLKAANANYDLRTHLLELNIHENIFQPALSASIVLTDSHNIPYKLPMVGEETVDIDIILAGLDGQGKEEKLSINPPRFHLNSLKDRYFTKPKAQTFSLNLYSQQWMSSIHSKVSKSYRGKPISLIVDDIFFNYLYDGERGLYFEPTDGNENIIIPNLSPIDAINWLSKRPMSRTEKNTLAVNYLFYETVEESHFTSLNTLVRNNEKDPIFTFIHRPRVDDPTGTGFVAKGIFKISKFEFQKQFNKTENTVNGLYSSKLITHDIVTKEIVQHDYKGFDEWYDLDHCGEFPPLSSSNMEVKSANVTRTSHAPTNGKVITNEDNLASMIDSKVDFYPKHSQMYSNTPTDLYDNRAEEWKRKRNAHMGLYDGVSLILYVSGFSGLRVGQVVNFILFTAESHDGDKKTENIIDAHLSGKFLVTGIQHSFSKSPTEGKVKYNMKIEITKDGVDEEIPFRVPIELEDF